jgi:hypothetical protein
MAAPERSSPRTGLLLLALTLAFAGGIGLLLDGSRPSGAEVETSQPAQASPSGEVAELVAPPSPEPSSSPGPLQLSRPSPSPTPSPAPLPQPEFMTLECLVTLDGVPQGGALLRLILPRGEEQRVESDAQGRAVLRLPRNRYARIVPSLPSARLDTAQVELLPQGQALELRALSSQTLLQIGDPLGAFPPGGPEDEDEGFNSDEVFVPTEGDPGVLQVAFSRGAELRGRVVDAGDRPVPGARVYLAPPEGWGGEPLPATSSDAEGRFALQLGAKAALEVEQVLAEVAEGGSGSAQPDRSDVGLAFEPFTIRLEAGQPFHGRVTDLEGRPLEARVSAEVGFLSDEIWRTTCDLEGRFWFGALAERGHWLTATLQVSSKGYAARTVEVSQGSGGTPVEVQLTPLTRCRGHVLSARGEPVAGARVMTLFDPLELGRRYGPANGGPDLDALATNAPLTDARGWFDFETPAGPRLLLVSAEGHGERVVSTSLLEGPLQIRLLPASVVAGTVHTKEGQALDYRLLLLVPTGYEPPQNLYEGTPSEPLRAGPTRALPTREAPTAVSATVAREGRFRFHNVPPGRYDVYGRALVWGSFSPRLVARGVDSGQLDVRAVFEPPPKARLELVTTVGGKPEPNGDCEFLVYDAAGRRLTTARPDSAGKVGIDLWAFGSLVVEGRSYGWRTIQRRLEVRPGETLTLAPFDFDAQVGTVSIWISGDEPYSEVSISGKDPVSGRWVEATYSMSGNDRLLSFPPGPASIRVRAYGGEEVLKVVRREVQVDLAETTTLRVDLSRE